MFGHSLELHSPRTRVQETVLLVNHALARGTPAIFVIFVVSRGSSSKALVLLVRMQIRHFRHFRQKPPFSGGTKARFTKSTVFGTPKAQGDFLQTFQRFGPKGPGDPYQRPELPTLPVRVQSILNSSWGRWEWNNRLRVDLGPGWYEKVAQQGRRSWTSPKLAKRCSISIIALHQATAPGLWVAVPNRERSSHVSVRTHAHQKWPILGEP